MTHKHVTMTLTIFVCASFVFLVGYTMAPLCTFVSSIIAAYTTVKVYESDEHQAED